MKETITKRALTFFGIAALMILFFACSDEPQIQEQQDKVTVSFSVRDDTARTVLPQVSLDDVASYKLLGGISGTAETVLVESFTGTGTSVSLDPGTWNFTLNAYNGDNEHILQGTVQNQQISLTGTNQISFSLSAVNSGTGAIEMTLNFPETAGITRITAKNDTDSEDFTPDDSGNFVYTKNEIAAGDYFINFELYRGDVLRAVVSELVLVRNNLTSSKTITLIGDNLKPLPASGIVIELAAMDEWELTEQTAQGTANENKIFTVTGTYTAYQWYLDGESVGTSASYTFNKPSGVYQLVVVVTNGEGESRSGRCRVTVLSQTPATYTVTFNANSGTGTAPVAQSVPAGSGITLPGQGALIRTGYIFGGWNTNTAGTGTNYNAGDTYTPTAASVTLYARWYTNYTVTFNANSGTGTAPVAQTVISGSGITLPGQGTLTRSGYNFGGWNTNTTGTGTNYNAGDTYTPTAASVTLYAKWNSTTIYTVTFNANSGTGTTPTAQQATAGTSITLPSQGNLARTGYTFDGWNTNTSGTGTNYNAGASYTPTGNVTLYAKWNSSSGGGGGPVGSTIFSEDFEGTTHSFTIVNGSQINKWYVGTVAAAQPPGSTKSAYISDNTSGSTNNYNISSTSIVHIYRDVSFPTSTVPYTLSFSWKAQGEGTTTLYDYLRVYLVETTTTITAGSQPSTGTILGTYNLGGTGWNQANISIPASNSGTSKRLVFTWVNDNSQGTQPPAAVDNIVLSGEFEDSSQIPSWVTGTLTTLTAGVWADGNIPSSSGEQWFRFTATAGTQYIHINFGTLSDLYIQLYDSNHTTVGTQSNLYGSTIYISRTVTNGQMYYIRVTPYGSNSGAYRIAFNTGTARPAL